MCYCLRIHVAMCFEAYFLTIFEAVFSKIEILQARWYKESLSLSKLLIISLSLSITACTTGQLYYVDQAGTRKLACDVEFIGMPSVDKYAVEYALSLCAKSAVKKGFAIEDVHLLKVDTTIPNSPCNSIWTHQLAKKQFEEGVLSKKEYGYIVAHIDLGLASLNECSL